MQQMIISISRWLVRILLLVQLFLSSWIVLPAPIFSLLPLSIGAPEISPVLIFANALALLLTWALSWVGAIRIPRLFSFTLCLSCLALVLSASPLLQFSSVQQQVERSIVASLGKNYASDRPLALTTRMRSKPLIISDIWGGISSQKVRIDRDILFASPDGVPLLLNIYRPTQVGTYPAIVSIYGGAWQRGSPDSDDNFNRYIAAQGYVVWAISYRHAPAYHFPTQIDDVRSALVYIKQRAIEYETDLDRVALLGRSAGAQLAMLAAYQDPPLPIKAVVNYYGPVDLTAGYNDVPTPDPIESRVTLRKFLGGTPTEFPELYYQASPLNTVKSGLPASLLIYGGKDHIIQSKYGRDLAQKLQLQGNKAIFIEIPWADHAFDAVFSGLSNQLALYYTERFLAWALFR